MDLLASTRRRSFACAILLAACGGEDGVGYGSTATTTGTSTSTGADTTTTSESSSTTDADSSSSAAPTMLAVDCADPPAGAVGASYSHTPTVSGDHGSVLWDVTGLPPGLTFAAIGGTIYGEPEDEGSYDVEITASEDGHSASATCTITIGAAFAIDLDALGKPCVEPGDDITVAISGGDGAAPSCTTPQGSGNGSIPDGITVDPDTCMIEGSITDGYGTWVWITVVEQSGVEAHVPYCATQDVLPMDWYAIDGDHSGQLGNVLEPAVGSFTPGQPIAWGGGGDPIVRVTGPCGMNSCYYGVQFSVGASPFDSVTLEPMGTLRDAMDAPIGLQHELTATGPAVPAAFEDRPWVLSWNMHYCIADTAAPCADGAAVTANGMGWLRFGTIMLPQ
ncbi:MAG: hypothetical protein K1X88_10270 [Nannocystaceae bacterium]|nr:hypothetical protein [Nannocystaceae bacterium]